jgi:hypothetical protein
MDPHVIVSPHTLNQPDSVTVLKSDVLLNGLWVQLGHTDSKATSDHLLKPYGSFGI